MLVRNRNSVRVNRGRSSGNDHLVNCNGNSTDSPLTADTNELLTNTRRQRTGGDVRNPNIRKNHGSQVPIPITLGERQDKLVDSAFIGFRSRRAVFQDNENPNVVQLCHFMWGCVNHLSSLSTMIEAVGGVLAFLRFQLFIRSLID